MNPLFFYKHPCNYYFQLHFIRLHRFLKDFGIHPVLSVLAGIVALVVGTGILVHKIGICQLLFGFYWICPLTSVLNKSDRIDFIKSIYSPFLFSGMIRYDRKRFDQSYSLFGLVYWFIKMPHFIACIYSHEQSVEITFGQLKSKCLIRQFLSPVKASPTPFLRIDPSLL